MSLVSKFNRKHFNFEIPENFKYKNLKEMFQEGGSEKKYVVKAIYINTNGKFGPSPLAVTNEELVNLPQHLLEVVKQMRDDNEIVDAINNSKVAFSIYKYNETNYSINWLDIN